MNSERSIHIVEDQQPLNFILEKVLNPTSNQQYTLSFSTNAQEAQAKLQNGSIPHLLILDLHLAGVEHGLDLLKFIRSNEQVKKLPVIVMTADADPNLQGACERLGVSGYFVKPFDLQQFTHAITEVFQKE